MKIQLLAGAQIEKGSPLLWGDDGTVVPVPDLDDLDSFLVVGYATDDANRGEVVEVAVTGFIYFDPAIDGFQVLGRNISSE